MKRPQIIIVFVAIIAALIIFNLPRGVIKNKKEAKAEDTREKTAVNDSDPEHLHETDVSAEDKENLQELTKKYLNFSDKEKKIKFADSLAKYYRKLHLYDSSAKYFEKVAVIEPSEENLVRTGDAFYDAFTISHDDEKPIFNQKAQEYYLKVLKQDPKNLDVKSKLAMTYVGGEATMEGVKLLREVIDADPKNETALYNLGILSVQSGQFDKAKGRFKELTEINPANSTAHFYLGMSYMNTGEKKKAKESFKIAKELNSDPAFQTAVDSYLKDLN